MKFNSRSSLIILLGLGLSACDTLDQYTVYCSGGCEAEATTAEAVHDMPYDQFPWSDDPSGHVTFLLDGKLLRVVARAGADAMDLDSMLDDLSPGGDDSAGVSVNGVWLALDASREVCREPGQPATEAPWNCLVTAQLGDRTRREADGSYRRIPGTFGVSSLQPVRLSNGRRLHGVKLPSIDGSGTTIVFSASSGQESGGVRFAGPEGGLHVYVIRRLPRQQQWSDPLLLTLASPFPYHAYPILSEDGQRLLMDCFDDLDVTLPRSICEVATDGSGFRVVVSPQTGEIDGRPSGVSGANHSAQYAPDGTIVFESDWVENVEGEWHRCEAVWRLGLDGRPVRVDRGRCDDNTPCVLPDGRVVSLWLPQSGHEIKVFDPVDGHYFMLMQGRDVADVTLSCSW